MGEFDIFRYLNADETKKFKAQSRFVEFKKGEVLFYQGDICDEIFYIVSGKAVVSLSLENYEQIHLHGFCQDEHCIVNLSSALSKSPSPITAVAQTSVKAYLMPVSLVKELMATSEAYQNFVFSLFSLRYSSLITLIENIKFKRLDSRIFEYLQSFKQREIFITNAQIAEHIGTSRAVVNRVLQDLKRRGQISLNRGKITML